MPRFEIPEGDHITVAYGYDDAIGYSVFLSVYDKRLMYDPQASREVNEIAEQIEAGEARDAKLCRTKAFVDNPRY
eukprot:Skav227283  [mRNA]  locus=scaffold4796:29191:29415:+ [translate_table: standard]